MIDDGRGGTMRCVERVIGIWGWVLRAAAVVGARGSGGINQIRPAGTGARTHVPTGTAAYDAATTPESQATLRPTNVLRSQHGHTKQLLNKQSITPGRPHTNMTHTNQASYIAATGAGTRRSGSGR